MFLSHMAEPCFGQIYLPMHLTIGLTQTDYLPVTQFWKWRAYLDIIQMERTLRNFVETLSQNAAR